MSTVTTHVLDTANGLPAAAMTIDLYQQQGKEFIHIKTVQTNADGRCDQPLLTNASAGGYQLVFDAAGYFSGHNIETSFLQDVVIRFYINEGDGHYHVPLLLSPFSYTTYRGS